MLTARDCVLFSTILLGVALVPAHATIIVTVDPDNYAADTNLTHAVSDVTISWLSQSGYSSSTYDPLRSDVFGRVCTGIFCAPDTGTLAFGRRIDDFTNGTQTLGVTDYQLCFEGNMGGCRFGFSVIEFYFASLTDFVQLGFGFASDGPGLLFYDDSDSLIAFCGSAFGGREVGPCDYRYDDRYPGSSGYLFSLSTDSRNIRRVVAGGWPGSATVNSVGFSTPEPGPLALFGVGLAGLALRRRRNAN